MKFEQIKVLDRKIHMVTKFFTSFACCSYVA